MLADIQAEAVIAQYRISMVQSQNLTPKMFFISQRLSLLASVFAAAAAATSNVDIILSTSQCVYQYHPTFVRNLTHTIDREALPKTSVFATAAFSLVKTVVLTPRPYITTEDATRTVHEVTSVPRPDPCAPTSYGKTITVHTTVYAMTIKTITVNETVTMAGTPTQCTISECAHATANLESGDAWALQDEYWDISKAWGYTREAIDNRGSIPTAEICYVTVYTADFISTQTVKRSVPRETYTRTRLVDTTTSTRRVTVYPTPGDPIPTTASTLTSYVTHKKWYESFTMTETVGRSYCFKSSVLTYNVQVKVGVYPSAIET